MDINKLKKLRELTGISLKECQNALSEAQGDLEKAKEVLKKWGKEFAQKKSTRETKSGAIGSYVHSNRKIGVLLDIRCESDFVAKSENFKTLIHELCLQIASMDPDDKKSLIEQVWVKNNTKTIKDLIDEYVAKLGENITIERFIRYEI